MSEYTPYNQKYGDVDNVKNDAKTLRNMIDRQGALFLLDTIAEYIGDCAQRFKMSDLERETVRDSYVKDLRDAINERI